MATYLSKILINMHSLSDFRVRSGPMPISGDEAQMIKGLDTILCQGHFRLQTLYCRDLLDISKIIKSQTELQILGLYAPDSPGDILQTLKELHNAQSFLPLVLMLERELACLVPDHISIFPAFCSVDRRATIRQVLAQSFCKDQGNWGDYMVAKADNVTQLSIYLIDSSDMPFLYAFAKDMAVSFPRIDWLNLWFESLCEIPPQEIKEELCFFSYLIDVNIYVWPTAL